MMQVTAKKADAFHCPRWGELPALGLYMDQVVLVLEEAMGLFAHPGEKGVTASMINNYVKQKLVTPPEKKKYGRQQLATLVMLSVLKNVLSIGETGALVHLLYKEYGPETAYDMFCEKLENALRHTFSSQKNEGAPVSTPEGALDAAVLALMGKLFVQGYLAGAGKE